MIKVFFDASVLFSALYSEGGESRKLVDLVRQQKIKGIASLTVIEELERNVEKFKSPLGRKDIHMFIAQYRLVVRNEITHDEIKLYNDLVEEKDAHVIAGAVLTSCNYLVTLDKKHLNNDEIKKKIKLLQIVSPAELLYLARYF